MVEHRCGAVIAPCAGDRAVVEGSRLASGGRRRAPTERRSDRYGGGPVRRRLTVMNPTLTIVHVEKIYILDFVNEM